MDTWSTRLVRRWLALLFGVLLGASAGVSANLLDVDSNGTTDAATDGQLILRHLFGFSGAVLTEGVLGPGATRTDPGAIADHIEANRIRFDIDSNGVTDALTDGLLVLRRLSGFSDAALIDGVLAPDAQRSDSTEVASYIDGLVACCATENQAPEVHAGDAQQITLPADSVALDGSVTDDGLPDPPGQVTLTWSQDKGPDGVTFTDASAEDTVAVFPGAGTYVLRLTADDGALSAHEIVTITVGEEGEPILPPDPADVAPPIDPTRAATLYDSTAFLYTGDNPIQTGLDPNTIAPERAAVVRGLVEDRSGNPIPGVTVSILNHPEYGQTLTRADGIFDIAVNGGSHLKVDYALDGYLPAQRLVDVHWNTFVYADDVVMLTLDSAVTEIDLSASGIQVAQSSVYNDEAGPRRATLLFPDGLTAEMLLPDGSTQSISTINVRATEYTVGPNGPRSMPAPLPPTSGYTHAIEYSVDEALALGATRISFSNPVITYIDNFLRFPVGMAMPTGYYDRARGVWVASPDGIIVEILSIEGDEAQVDTSGDGLADNGVGLGMTLQERRKLAGLFESNESFWRVPIPHFTPWDHNLPYGPPDDAIPPRDTAVQIDEKKEDPCETAGSIIECENQVLGERVPVVGTNTTLNYRSDRMPGRTTQDKAVVVLSGETLPASLEEITLEITVAGNRTQLSFPPETNLSYTFDWDGVDVYGRPVPGAIAGLARIGYRYTAIYQEPGINSPSFGELSGNPIGGDAFARFIYSYQDHPFVVGNASGRVLVNTQALGGWSLDLHHSYDPTIKKLYLGEGRERSARDVNRVINTVIGEPVRDPCCGSNTCFLDDVTYNCEDSCWGEADFEQCVADCLPSEEEDRLEDQTWYCENEESLTQEQSPSNVAVDARGSLYYTDAHSDAGRIFKRNPVGDTTPIDIGVEGLGFVSGLDFGADGFLYVSEIRASIGGNAVWKVDPRTGAKTHLAGQIGAPKGISGDGGPAIDAVLDAPAYVVAAPDGTIYFYEIRHYVIRRIGTNGIISTIAGQPGVSTFAGDEPIVASAATLQSVGAMALGPNGDLFFAETRAHRVRKIGTNGILTTVAGSGPIDHERCEWPHSAGDGGPATSAQVPFPQALEVDTEGRIYVSGGTFCSGIFYAETWGDEVRVIDPNGIINTFAGGSSMLDLDLDERYELGDGGPATAAFFRVQMEDIAKSPDGTVYIVDARNQRIRSVQSLLPGFSATDLVIPSEDGDRYFRFDSVGRHLSTHYTLTGATLYEFDYDAEGHLNSVTDANNLVTTVERDGTGQATAIIGPYGARTPLTLDPNGYLSAITNPAGETYALSYDATGLLKGLTDPNNQNFVYTYDPDGRLLRNENPAGGFVSLSRADLLDGFEITQETALGRTKTIRTLNDALGGQIRTTTFEDGTQYLQQIDNAGTETITSPNGNVEVLRMGGDPIFGLSAEIVTSETLTTPAGLTMTIDRQRDAELADPGDLSSLTRYTESVGANGNAFRSIFTASTRTFELFSPKGRSAAEITVDDQLRPLFVFATGEHLELYDYDDLGRIERIRQGDRELNFTYNDQGYISQIRDAQDRVMEYLYDNAGRISQENFPGGRIVTYQYDDNGNRIAVTPPDQPVHSLGVNDLNLAETYSPPDLGVGSPEIRYDYDIDQELTQVFRADGQDIGFEYDADSGRLTSLTTPGGSTTFGYSTSGQINRVLSPNGIELAYGFDGFLPLSTTWSGPVGGVVSQTFDDDFLPRSQSINGTSTVNFSYDADTYLTGAGALSITRNFGSGRVESATIGALAETYDHNRFGELTGYSISNGTTLYEVGYEYDNIGHIVRKTESVGASSTVMGFSYDTAGRLKTVVRDVVEVASYAYDNNGNRTRFSDSSGGPFDTVVDTQDRLISYGDGLGENHVFTYSAVGDLSTRTRNGTDLTSYGYDALGNLTSVVEPTNSYEYLYDGQNRRVVKSINGVVSRKFLYQDNLNIVAELDAADSVVSRFVYGLRENVPDYMVKGDSTYRLIADAPGSVRLVVDVDTGAIVQQLDYDAFGVVVSDSNPGFQPFGYAGGLYDPDTGLVRFGARDYDPSIGRWTSKDPLGFDAGDTNLYAYVNNNPVLYIDPTGLRPWSLSQIGRELTEEVVIGSGKSAGKSIATTGEITPTPMVEQALESLVTSNAIGDFAVNATKAGIAINKSSKIYQLQRRRLFKAFRDTLDSDCPDREKQEKVKQLIRRLDVYAKQYGSGVPGVTKFQQDFASDLRTVGQNVRYR